MSKRRADGPAEATHTPAKRKQTYVEAYGKDFKFIQPSRKGEYFAFCVYCRCDLDISHAGRNDIVRHSKSQKHKAYEVDVTKTASMTAFLKTDSAKEKEEELELKTTRAELMMSELITELNLPLSAADLMTKAVKKMFPDSEISQKFQCGRRKTTCFIKELCQRTQNELCERMRTGPYTISTDGSNDDL